MNDRATQRLGAMLAQFGAVLLGQRDRLGSLLRDECGDLKREINVLLLALQEHIPQELRQATAPRERALQESLARRLVEDRGIDPDMARWAVSAWTQALVELEAGGKAAGAPAHPPLRPGVTSDLWGSEIVAKSPAGTAPAPATPPVAPAASQSPTGSPLTQPTGPAGGSPAAGPSPVRAAGTATNRGTDEAAPVPGLVQRLLAWFRLPDGSLNKTRAALAGAAIAVIFGLSFRSNPAPVIERIEFAGAQFPGAGDAAPKLTLDGKEQPMRISFRDPNGDLVGMVIDFVEPLANGKKLEPAVVKFENMGNRKEGVILHNFKLSIWGKRSMRIALVDAAGNVSQPVLVRYEAQALPNSAPSILGVRGERKFRANGQRNAFYVDFQDPDGDIAGVEFRTMNRNWKDMYLAYKGAEGTTQGELDFWINATTEMKGGFRIVVIDKKGNRSAPFDLVFESVR